VVAAAEAIPGPTQRPLHADLYGENEIAPDGTTNAGDRDGSGAFAAVIRRRTRCFGLTVRNLEGVTGAHVHRGAAGANGPIVVSLSAPTGWETAASSGCVRVASSLARAIRRNPRRYYVSVHTDALPNGAIRGQLRRL
jgi:hypothetical protein